MSFSDSDSAATQRLALVVHAVHAETDRIAVLDLRDPRGLPLPRFEAGAHVDVHLGPTLVRQYSLSNDPHETHRYVIGVLLDQATRGGSAGVHRLRPGDMLSVGLPRNSFGLHDDESPAVLLAGGIGVTPLKSMLHALHRRRVAAELHYFARTRSAAAFLSELTQPPLAEHVTLHCDDEPGASRFDWASLSPAASTQLYLCGPTGFIEQARRNAVERGFSAGQIHIEHFGADAPATALAGDEFVVEAVRSGVQVTVAADETIAHALERAGLQVLTSCEQGLCGVCLTRVISGVPDHRDDVQTDAEKQTNEKITICCSRSRSPLLQLDL